MPAASNGYRYALNPIQWFATDDGWLDPAKGPAPRELLALIAEAGFPAVHAQVPAGWTVDQYAAALKEAGLQAAPGYFSMPLPEQGVDAATTWENVRVAAGQQAALGLSAMFLACRMTKDAPRVARPGIGADYDEGRFATILDMIGKAADLMRGEGIYPLLHPHIGTWIETEAEARRILDAIPADRLGFGPDTGHLTWASADVEGLIARYRDRIGAVHVKDCKTGVRDACRAAGRTYQQTVVAGLWAEPGTGDLDLAGMLGLLGPSFDGWLVAEVDFPSMPSFECAQVSARWLAAQQRPAA